MFSISKQSTKGIEVFYSYSHRDQRLRDQLEIQLALLKREGLLSGWHDRKIEAGEEWRGKIDTHLNTAQIILLLISADFIASDYCYDIELRKALERHNAREARVIPIILRPCDWQNASFGKLQALPTGGKPITGRSWHNRDEAFLDVAKGIRKAIEDLSKYNEEVAETIELRELLHPKQLPWANQSQRRRSKVGFKKTVFIVYGRNNVAKREMFAFLYSIGLSPVEWSQTIERRGEASPFIEEILDAAFSIAQAVIVLLTGDDEARLRSEYQDADEPYYETHLIPQPRQNVLFWAGMALGSRPKRTVLVEVGALRPFSAVSGYRVAIRLNNKTENRLELAQRLMQAGCVVDLSGNDWVSVGNFDI